MVVLDVVGVLLVVDVVVVDAEPQSYHRSKHIQVPV